MLASFWKVGDCAFGSAWNSCSWVLFWISHGDSIVAFQRNAVWSMNGKIPKWNPKEPHQKGDVNPFWVLLSIEIHVFHVPNAHCWGNFQWGSFSNNMSLFYVILHMFLFSSACFPFCPYYLWLVAGVIRMNSNFITHKKNSMEIISCRTPWGFSEFRKEKHVIFV